MGLHTFRVEFADETGMLARLTSAIATCGGNITTLDVQELDGDTVVDEIVVDTGMSTPAMLREALLTAGATTVTSTSATPRLMDALVGCLDGLAEMASMIERGIVDAAPCALLVRLGHADMVEVVPATPDHRAVAEQAPTVERIGDEWVLALPHPEADPRVVYVARRAWALRFSATEVARLRALLRLHERLTSGAPART